MGFVSHCTPRPCANNIPTLGKINKTEPKMIIARHTHRLTYVAVRCSYRLAHTCLVKAAYATEAVQFERSPTRTVFNKGSDLQNNPLRRQDYWNCESEIVKKVVEFRRKHGPKDIIMIRVGDFYEFYGPYADMAANLLNLAKTQKRINSIWVDFTGFPFRLLDRHLETFVLRHRHNVYIYEQYRSAGRNRFERRLARCITPGTLTDENLVNPAKNNFLLYVNIPGRSGTKPVTYTNECTILGLAWADLFTGDFFTASITADSLKDHMAAIRPIEVVISSQYADPTSHPVSAMLHEDSLNDATEPEHVINYLKPVTAARHITFKDPFQDRTYNELAGFSETECDAGRCLLNYIQQTAVVEHVQLQKPERFKNDATMKLDRTAVEQLEIFRTMRTGQPTGTLFHMLAKTATVAGRRLLQRRLSHPMTSATQINAELDRVEFFRKHGDLTLQIRSELRVTKDGQAALQAILNGRKQWSYFAAVLLNLAAFMRMRDAILPLVGQGTCFEDVLLAPDHRSEYVQSLKTLQGALESQIMVNRGQLCDDAGMINPTVDANLTQARSEHTRLLQERDQLLKHLQKTHGTSDLAFTDEWLVQVPNREKHSRLISASKDCVKISATSAKVVYSCPPVSALGSQIDAVKELITKYEDGIHQQLVDSVSSTIGFVFITYSFYRQSHSIR